jgi:phage baseplate assembly protein W
MAYEARNISPLDLRASTGIGVAIPFSAQGVFTTVYTTQEQLKYNIINYLLTGKRERVFQPGFGAGLRDKLFEQITEDTAALLESTIRAGVESNFPNVSVVEVKVTASYDQNTININFSYRVQNTGQTDEILLNFQNG